MSDLTDQGKKRGTAHENLLEILDNVIRQLDFTKKMIIIMVLSFIIIIPAAAVIIGALSISDTELGVAIPIIAVTVFLVWLGVGIRQWIVFSRWSKKYRHYKEQQKKVDERLDFDNSETPKGSQ
jgi:uncharacterized membrane protein